MIAPSRQRTPNPHLGAYYGIVASAFVSLVILLAMAEQLGWSDGTVARSLILLPLAAYLGIAVAARTLDVEDFFASGRRVPQVYNALLLAAIAVGGHRLLRLYRRRSLPRLRRACHRARLDVRLPARRGSVRAVSAPGRLLHAPCLYRPAVPVARGPHRRVRPPGRADRAVARRRDQDRGRGRLDLPAAPLLARRAARHRLRRGGRHPRRHARR